MFQLKGSRESSTSPAKKMITTEMTSKAVRPRVERIAIAGTNIPELDQFRSRGCFAAS